MKKRLNSSILAATSLTAITVQHQAEASSLILTAGQLSALSAQNQLESSDVTTLDFSNMTPDIVNNLRLVQIDLSSFQNVRNIILPWFAANLNIKLPGNFSTPLDNTYSRLTIIQAGVAPSSDSDLILNLETLLNQSGKVILDTKAVAVTELKTGSAVAKIERNVATTNLTVTDNIQAIDTDGVIADDVKTSITVTPSAVNTDQGKAPFAGLPTAVIGASPNSLDISAYTISGKDVTVSGMPNLTNLVIAAGDSIGSLKVTGETTVTTNATSINKLEVTSDTPDQTAVDTMAVIATTVAPSSQKAHTDSFLGKTELDFSKLDLGSVEATAARIKDIFDEAVPITSIVSMKISSSVLAAVMTKLNITNLSSFSALKRLDIISATGAYQTSALTSADLPSSLEAYYSSNLVVRKGTLSADLEFDSKFSAATLDLSGLVLNGYTLTIANSFTANSVSTLKLNPSLLAVAATKNLISANSSKSITVSGAASGALTTTNLQNVGTIDLRLVTGATSLSAPLNVDGNNSILSSLYLPSAFDVEATADILNGVDNGEVTVYVSGAYSGAKTLDASYDKTTLNFSGVTGTGLFQLPAGVRGLVLSNAVKGINVGAVAVQNEFDFSGLTYIRQITDLPASATVLKLNNASASAALQLNLTALTSLTTLHLGSSKVSQLSLPASATLTNGGEVEHLDLSNVTNLAELNGLNALLAAESITQVSFPNSPASTLHINLVDTIGGVRFNNLYKIPELTIDSDYAPGENMWPTVKRKSSSADWSIFFNYIIAPVVQGGINSPSIFDLSGQAIENQTQANALVIALNDMSQANKSLIQKIVIRLDAAISAPVTIDLSAIVTTDFSHGSLKIIIDQSTGSTATVSVPGGWTSKTKTHIGLGQVDKETAASWTKYLDYRFASLNDKGEAATSLDLSSIDLTAAKWSALMTSLNSFATPEAIETIRLKLVAANDYSPAPAFTTATLSAATSIIVDVTGVKNVSTQVSVTGLPSATVNLQVEQRVTAASSVDRTVSASWKGYVEHLLSNISGTNYTLDLTASDVRIQTAAQLTALNSALAELSAANKIKIEKINLKLASGDRAADFTVSTNFTGFTNIASLVVDGTDALNGATQSAITFSLTNAPAYAKAHVTNLASVDTDVAASWDYYLAYRLATDGVGLTNLDVSSISLTAQADLTAFLTALNDQASLDKSNVQSIKLKLASSYTDNTVDFSIDLGSGEITGLDHVSFAVEVDRNGANSTAPVSFAFGDAITASNTTIKDTAFTGLGLGLFDGADAHHWLGYVRTLLGTVASGTTTLDLSINNDLEMNSAIVAKFITAMNALPATDKAKVATLKIKLASIFGAATTDLSGLIGFSALTSLVVERNGARTSTTLYAPSVSVTGSGTVTINDPELRSVSSTGETNKWLGYLRFVLNGMSGVANTVDLSAFSVDNANATTAINNALESLPASEKLKVQTLKLSASFAVTLGTSVTGFTNLTKVIVDQTAAPTVTITIAAGTVATGEFADATTQKFYVTSAATAQTNNAWAKYIDYAMSSVANGGLNQTTFDLTGLTFTNTQAGQFLTALNTHASVANVTGVSLKLAPSFGASTLDLSSYTGFSSLADDGVIIYRNGSSTDGSSAPVTIIYGGSFTDAKVKIIDPTATTVADTAIAQQWLGYLTGVLNDSASGATLDLSSIAIDDAQAVTAFNAAIACLDSALSSKVTLLKLAVTHAADITLGTGSAGFSNLSRIEFTKTATHTVTFAGALSVGRTYLTNLASVKMDTSTDWSRYLNYMLSTTHGGQSASSLNLNSLTFADQAAVDAFFAGLHALSSKNALTTLRMKLANGLEDISIGGSTSAATGLAAGLRVIVSPGTSTGTIHAGSNAEEVQADNLIVLASVAAFSKGHIAYLAEQGSFAGTIDLTALNIQNADGATLIQELNLLSADTKSAITTINLKLQSGAFGSSTLTLGTLTGFTGVTFNIDRNGAVNNTPESALVVIVNNTGHTVNLTDAEFHNMSTFDNESSAHWIGYLTHELNSAAANYTLDLTVNAALMLDSANAVSAFSSALRYLPDSLKAKAALLKVKSSTNGELGTSVTGFSNLATIVIDYLSTGLNMNLGAGFGNTPTQYSYISTPFNGMDWNDWTKFFNYTLNSAAIGGIEQTTISLDKRLSSADLTAILAGLNAATNKASLANLILNLASSVTGNINVGASGLTAISTVTINTNGSVARLTPSDDFYDKTTITSVLNVNPAVQGSWRAYLKGQSSIAAIDIREVEFADQPQLTAFLTALNAEGPKATVATIKIKLASSYAGTVDFSGVAPTGLTALTANNSVEVHRNGSGAAVTQGGDITDAKIKLVDLTASSLTDRSSAESWRRYLTALIEATPGAVDLALDSDTYLRTNAHATAFMSGLNNLSPANKLLVTSLKLELAPGAAWTNIANLGQGLTGFDNLTSFIVDATGAYTSAGGNPQVTVAFHADMAGVATKKAIVSSLSSVDKDSQASWTYYFNSAAMTSVDVSAITLTSAEAAAFLAALGTGVTAKDDITALTMKLDPTFGAASLAINGSGFNITATAFTVHRNGAANAGSPVALSLTSPTGTSSLSIVDPTITDADSVLKTSASSWLSYLTYALAGSVTELDLTDDNLVLGTVGQATALSTALDALDSTLKAKIVTLKVKAAVSVTIGATLTTAAGFTALTVVELDKPAANTIAVSTVDATTQLRIAALAKVKRDSSSDWLAYIQYLMKDLGAVTNFDLDMTASPLAEGEALAFVASLATIGQNANSSGNTGKIQKVRLKLAPGAWSANVTNLGAGWSGSMNTIDTFTVDATGATFAGAQLTVGFHGDLTAQSEYTKAFITDINSVDKDSAASWEYYLNYVTRSGAAGFDVSALTLTVAELTALNTALNTFSTAAGNGAKLSSIHIKVSGAAGAATVNLTADLDDQTAINTAAEFIVDVSGFTHTSSQAIVDHTGGDTPKDIELRIASASDLYRNSSASWGMYLNSVYAGGLPATSTVDLTSSSSLYLRSQADVNALMTAIQARSDKGNISTLNVRLAPGSVGSDIVFGTGVTGINPTMTITATGATNNGSMISSADIRYAGSFTSAGKTVTQAFASSVTDKTVQANWTKYLTYALSSVDAGGLGQVSIVPTALTSGAQLTALLNALDGLSSEFKASIQHLHLDVSHASFNGALTLGTGVSGLSNLQEVTYVRASAQADATAAGSFVGKIQRLRTALNADTLTSSTTLGEYLRYVLMDVAMGGAEQTLVDLTSQALDNAADSVLYSALLALPAELMSRIIELRLKFNTSSGGSYATISLPNLTTAKYFQTGSANFVAPSSNTTVTTTRFRALLADVSDKTVQAQWTNYIDYVMTPTGNGGLGQTTLDLSSITLTSAQAVPFLAALNAHASKAAVTALTLKLDPTFGAASLNLSSYTGFTGLTANSVTIHRNAAVNADAPVTITYGGSFTDANVKIIDPETNTTADKDNTRQQWLEYLTYTLNTVGLTSGLLTIAPTNKFTDQAGLYLLFDAMEALDPSLKPNVVIINIDLSSITGGTVSLKRTDNLALTGFSNLTKVIYARAGIDTNIDTIITDLTTALDIAIAVPGTVPAWVFADEVASDTAIGNAVGDGSIRTAISDANVAGLKSALVTQLANGILFPASDVCDTAVDTAATDVSVTVDDDVITTLETALEPFRSTGKIANIETALTMAFTNGVTTGLGTLPWLKSAWSGYADHDAVMTAVLADGAVTTAISTDGQTVANIKTAVSNYLDNFLLPYGTLDGGSAPGSLGRIIFDMNLTALASWNNGSSIETRNAFRAALEDVTKGLLESAWIWFASGVIATAVNEIFPAEDGYFPLPTTNGNWDATTIKQELFDRLKGIDDSLVIGFSTIKASIPTMINAAFTAENATLTTNTAAWVRPTAQIEADLTTSVQSALSAFPWYTGNAATQAAAAVTAGNVANQDAATIISNIKTWLAANVVRPTANSIFTAGVTTAVNSISLATASTTVTTDFAGVAETLSRYRVAINDITDKENAGQWVEYLLHKLRPVALGGLGATTIDVSSVDFSFVYLGNDQLTHLWGGLRDGALDAYRANITSIKFALDNTGGNVTLDGGGKTFNNNLKIVVVMNNKPNNTFTLQTGESSFKNSSNAELPNSIIDLRITTALTVAATALEWQRWLNHQLSSTFGGAGVTSIDLSGTHSFASQAQLNAFFAGLEALDGTGSMANKNLLASLTLKLAAGNFGAASARIGYTGSAAVTNLKANIAITIQRNGARNGAGTESALVTINHADIDAISTADGVTVDNTDATDVDNLSWSAEWLEYLNSTLTAAGAAYTLDLTAGGFQLNAGTSATQATALFNALQALNPTLKAKIDTIKIKLAAGNHGAGDLTLTSTLDISTGFTALARIIVDVTDAETNTGGTQKLIDFSGVTVEAGVKKVMWVNALASVDFDSSNRTASWLAYVNYITRTGNSALDTSAINSGNGLTVSQLNGLFDALAGFSTANDNPARLTGVTAKLAAAAGIGTFAVNQFLTNLSGLTSIIIDATGAMHSEAQVTANFGVNLHANTTTKEARVTSLASVDLDNADSWGYYLNYVKATNGNIESIDLSTRDLADTDSGTTQPYVNAFFAALEVRADKATVKDIYLNISGVDSLTTLPVGTGSSGLTALTSVVIKRHSGGGSSFLAAGGVGSQDRAIINSDPTDLGTGGNPFQWKGYLAYLLEDIAHGGVYTGSNPIAVNLTAAALNVNLLGVLKNIEQAIAELPARLKARISAILIKTTASAEDYTADSYQFGDAFTAPILAEYSELKAVVIDASDCTGTKPVFDTAGTFFNASTISKIVY